MLVKDKVVVVTGGANGIGRALDWAHIQAILDSYPMVQSSC